MTSERLAEPVLKISGLVFSYPDGNTVLESVNLEVMLGERVGLIGPNGAGKTTLFLQICGVLKPSAGEVSVLGRAVLNGRFYPDVGLVFQNSDDELFCPSVIDRPPHHLSEGEKRMVSIAGVLAMQPRVVIYDEPSANLDIRSRRRLIRLLQASNETILIASHDLELVLEVCDRVVLMDRGLIVADGNPREIMCDDRLMEAHGQEKPHSLIPHNVPQ